MVEIEMVGFDADDTLWRSQEYFEAAQDEFERIIGSYVDLADARVRERLYEVEHGNVAVFGYGVKGMALSMIEAAVRITDERIRAHDLHRIVGLAKTMLRHPVELLSGIRDAVEAIAAEHPIVMITKGDLFHQESKVRQSGMAHLFRRIEIVSEKDMPTYLRLFEELGVRPARFVMIGNSLRSDIAPVLALGGWGIHMPYHVTWAHESAGDIDDDARTRMLQAEAPSGLPGAVRQIARRAAPAVA